MIVHKQGKSLEFFDGAKEIEEGTIFITRKDNIEGRDKAILVPMNSGSVLDKASLVSDIRYVLKNYYDEIPLQVLMGIHQILMEQHESKVVN